ncbi:MAG: hypothetical protein LLF77_00905 [Synergistaceae bacterium]|nr:hypothetical protein [Synergistaceae bacterium]
MTSLTATRRFFNCRGQAYAHITAGTLIKNEKEKDRLIILNRQGYALDISLLNEAIEAGATQLEIREKTLTGSQRAYKIALRDIQKHARHVTLAGIPRYAFSLAWCELVSGLPEPWQITEHARWIASQSKTPTAREEQHTQQQASLFCDQELQSLAQMGRWE